MLIIDWRIYFFPLENLRNFSYQSPFFMWRVNNYCHPYQGHLSQPVTLLSFLMSLFPELSKPVALSLLFWWLYFSIHTKEKNWKGSICDADQIWLYILVKQPTLEHCERNVSLLFSSPKNLNKPTLLFLTPRDNIYHLWSDSKPRWSIPLQFSHIFSRFSFWHTEAKTLSEDCVAPKRRIDFPFILYFWVFVIRSLLISG